MKIKLTLLVLFLTTNLLACSTSNGPEQVAVYPQEPVIAVYPHQTEKKPIYNATLEIEVSKVERTAERAKDIAFEQGGYLVSSRSWFQCGCRASRFHADEVRRWRHNADCRDPSVRLRCQAQSQCRELLRHRRSQWLVCLLRRQRPAWSRFQRAAHQRGYSQRANTQRPESARCYHPRG